MHRRRFSSAAIHRSILVWALVAFPAIGVAQRHGGVSSGSNPILTRPDGVDSKDSLKDFHEAMAVQATSDQIAEFQAVVKATDAAKAQLQAFVDVQGGNAQGKSNGAADSAPPSSRVDQSLEGAQSENKKFVAGFSAEQKSGLKETIKRLDKANSDLEQEQRKFDPVAATSEATARAQSLGKALDDFSDVQLALGREMGIVLANGQDTTFNLTPVRSPVTIGQEKIAVSVSGQLTQVSAQGSQRIFKLEMAADMPDLQQNITDILRAELDTPGPCGERIAVRQAMLTPATPAGLLVMQLHYERWACARGTGPLIPSEIAESDGQVEMKITAALEKPGADNSGVKLKAEFQRIDASGMMGESLRSGALGDDLREKVADALASVVRAGADFKVVLPPAVQNFTTLESVRFADTGAGRLSATFEGQIQLSDEQATLLANQLNQALSAQQTPSR
jgi:hypothetical protein